MRFSNFVSLSNPMTLFRSSVSVRGMMARNHVARSTVTACMTTGCNDTEDIASVVTASAESTCESLEAAKIEDGSSYVPPKVWSMGQMGGNKFSAINRPTAGPRQEQKLAKGEHPLQLYSLGTPNGQKVTILLEELLAAGYDAEYDAWLIDIMQGDQFGSDFVQANPNSKIPALLDYSNNNNGEAAAAATRVFESGSILLYLSEKYENAFVPRHLRAEVINWLFWQMSSAPILGGGFGHFFVYADQKQEYPINRFTMETKRQLDVLNRQLATTKNFIVGDDYTLADIAIFPWYGGLALGGFYGDAKTFLNIDEEYPHLVAWAHRISSRSAVRRGSIVNKNFGDLPHLRERHCARDIDEALTKDSDRAAETPEEGTPRSNAKL